MSDVQRAVEALDAKIAALQAAKDELLAVQANKPKRARKLKVVSATA